MAIQEICRELVIRVNSPYLIIYLETWGEGRSVDLLGRVANNRGIHLTQHEQIPANLDFDKLAAATESFSGAKIEQAANSALCSAYAQNATLTTDRILKEDQSTYPLSVTMKERIDSLRDWARERAVQAN